MQVTKKDDEKAEERDMATVMSGAIERLCRQMGVPDLDCEMNVALPETFLKIVPSYTHIPLFDANQMALVPFAPDVLQRAGTLERIMKEHTFEEAPIIEAVRHQLAVEMESNQMLGRTPEFYAMALCKANTIPFMTTEMDDTVRGFIYTLATQMPSQEHVMLQHAYYSFLVGYLFQQLPINKDSEVRYAYLITEGNRLNLFMSIVR